MTNPHATLAAGGANATAPLFVDTEFTSFGRMELISIGAVTLDGREFYAETSDHDASDRTDFVRATVVPLLRGGAWSMPRAVVAERLRAWVDALGGAHRVVCDYSGDWALVAGLLDGRWPERLARAQHTWTYGLATHGPADVQAAKRRAWDAAQAHFAKEPQHHALHDARAMRAAWIAEDPSAASTSSQGK